MGIEARLFLVPPAAALFGASSLAAAAWSILPSGSPAASISAFAAAGAAAAGLPAMVVCRKWCRARRESMARADRFKSIWDGKLTGMCVIGGDGRIREANDAFLRMTGYSREDLADGIPSRDLIPADQREHADAKREKLRREGHAGPHERDLIRKDGGRFTNLIYASRLGDGSILGMALDIQEWKSTQRELRKRESRYRDLLSCRLIGIFVTDMQGRISEANDAFLAMAGRTRAELDAGILTSQNLATPEWMYGALARKAQFDAHGTMGPLERDWPRPDGTLLHTLFFATRMEEGGKALCMAIDVNELKQVRSQLAMVESRYKKLFDSNIVGVAIADGSQTFVEANETFLRMTGYDRAELEAGRLTGYALRRPDAERRLQEPEGDPGPSGRMPPMETVYARKDGGRIPVFRAVTRLEEKDRFLHIAIDLSVLKATQTTDVPAPAGEPAESGSPAGGS